MAFVDILQPNFPEAMSYDHANNFESGSSMNPSSSRADSGRKPSARPSTPSKNAAASAEHRCSYCGTSFVRSQSRHMPFCSKRCQQIDLGMWLNESYGFPYEGDGSVDHHGVNAEEDLD